MKPDMKHQYSLPDVSGVSDEFTRVKNLVFANLKKHLDEFAIPKSAYVIDGEGTSGQLCIWFDTTFWVVFTSERGERFNCVFFSDPWQATAYFFWELLRTHSKLIPALPLVGLEL